MLSSDYRNFLILQQLHTLEKDLVSACDLLGVGAEYARVVGSEYTRYLSPNLLLISYSRQYVNKTPSALTKISHVMGEEKKLICRQSRSLKRLCVFRLMKNVMERKNLPEFT